jgi:hypothetical protein
MKSGQLKERLAALEAEVARLRSKLEQQSNSSKSWTEQIAGIFAGDPAFEEAMHLGRRYRESLRPKAKRSRKR